MAVRLRIYHLMEDPECITFYSMLIFFLNKYDLYRSYIERFFTILLTSVTCYQNFRSLVLGSLMLAECVHGYKIYIRVDRFYSFRFLDVASVEKLSPYEKKIMLKAFFSMMISFTAPSN